MKPEKAEGWLARGRRHQWASRPLHALFSFKSAIVARPRNGAARFHMGEVLWQLGLSADAKAMWREATTVRPRHVPSWLAYAEASLNTGDPRSARDAAAAVLALQPDETRARVFLMLAEAALGEGEIDAGALADIIATDPDLVLAPARAGLIARSLERAHDAAGQIRLFGRLAAAPAAVPLDLLAWLASYASRSGERNDDATVDAILDQAAGREVGPGSAEALRTLARAARDVGRRTRSKAFAEAYARICLRTFAPPVATAWPRRTAGAALRVALLASPRTPPETVASLAALREAGASVTLVALVAPQDLQAFTATLPFTPQAAIATGDTPEPSSARLVAARDPDVVIDAIGLDAPTGPWLAQRPGRAVWTLADLGEPLADRRVEPDAASLAGALDEIPRTVEGALSAEALAAHWNAGLRAHQSGDVGSARAAYSAIVADQPTFAPALHFRARLEWDAGDLEAASRDLEATLASAPAYQDARVDASRLSLERERFAAAIAEARDGLERDPEHLGLLRALGHALLRVGDGPGAVEAFHRAATLRPLDAETHYNLGVAQQLAGDTKGAARSYRYAGAFDPGFVDAAYNLAVLLQQEGRVKASLEMYRQVVERDPTRAAAWKNLGEVLREDGQVDAWLANFRRFEVACPGSLLLAVHALEACQFQADFAKLDRYLDGLRQERFRAKSQTELVDALEELLYLLLFFDVEPDVMHRFARTYDEAARSVYGEPRPGRAARAPGRLRLGYLSADLRNHVMGKMMLAAIRHHDRERFDVFLYSMSDRRDRVTEAFESVATAWRDLSAVSDREAARIIEADDLDLLVDLQTHTKGARPGILALKPARAQLTHVASAGTLGLSTIDFKLTDAYADLPEAQEHQLEPLLAMEGSVYPWRAVQEAEVPPLSRSRFAIPDDAFVIGAFVAPMKLSRRCLALWKEIADRVPRARFAFSPVRAEYRPAFEKLAATAGIAADRLLFLPQGRNDAENQSRYRLVDAVLDPMPFGNVNGTIEPLAMGVPVVTLVGRRHGERTSWSILANLGVTSTVAQSGREYVDLAVRLAEDAGFARSVRESIARGLASSTLVDRVSHARHLEAAYVVAIGKVAPEALEEAARGAAPPGA